MKTLAPLVGLALFLSACATDRYQSQPEGTVSESEPEGYEEVVYNDITYWHSYGHYYRYWPGSGWVVVRPPIGRPPYPRPPKPVHPIEPPPTAKPKPLPAQPGQPTTRPVQRPVQRPVSPPVTRPMPTPRPTTRPALR